MYCIQVYGPGLLIYPVMMTKSQWKKGKKWSMEEERGVVVGDLPAKPLSQEQYNKYKDKLCLVTLRQKTYDELYDYFKNEFRCFSSYHPSYPKQFVTGMYSLLEFIHPPNQKYNLRTPVEK